MGSRSTQKTRLIAFLRAINVGGHNVKMDRLRELFEALGLSNVESFIASGNVIFDSPGKEVETLEKEIEDHLRSSLGYDVATFIRSDADLADIVSYQPFSGLAREGSSLYIAFLPAPLDAEAVSRLLAFRSGIDDFHVRGREVYWLCRTRMSESAFSGALLEKTIGMPATMRNANTLERLAAKYPGPS